MEFIESHWHCIVPAVVIIAVLLLRSLPQKKGDKR